jgi:5-bromo-4-chloroindolyl phosphate hydrolysis protein.
MDRKPTVYKIKYKKSPAPFYAVGIFWFIYALMFPMYLWYHYAVAGVLSVLVFTVFNKLFAPQKMKIEKPYKAPLTGDSDIDKSIKAAENDLQSIYDSTSKIAAFDSMFAGNIADLITDGRKIIEYLATDTKKINMLRRFFNYYLPTLDKLLKNYLTLIKHKSETRDFDTSKQEIETAVEMMKTVFSKQLDKLLDDLALDISTDTEVLEAMLANSGFTSITEENSKGGAN